MSATDVGAALPRARAGLLPALTPLIVAAIAAPLIGSWSTFVTLTLAEYLLTAAVAWRQSRRAPALPRLRAEPS